MRQPTWRDRLHGWAPWLGILYLLACLVFAWLFAGLFQQYMFLPGSGGRTARPVYVIYLIVLALSLALVAAVMRVPAHFLPELRRDFRRRKQLASLLTLRHRLPPGALATLLEDEESYVLHLQRFLAEHRIPYAPSLLESLGISTFASRRKVQILAEALLRAVSRGHDNELFVLLVHLLEVPEHLGPLLRAVRVALSRHHRVMVICPWPEEVAPGSGSAPLSTLGAPGRIAQSAADGMDSAEERWQQAFQQVRRAFARLGILTVPARGGDPARLILERLDRLRMQGRKR